MNTTGRILTTTLSILLFACTSLAQSVGGIGASLALDTAKDGTTLPRIKGVAPNSPAAESLKEGLFILSGNDISFKNKGLEEVVGVIRGEAGSKVKLSVSDNAAGRHAQEYTLTRVTLQMAAPSDPATAFFESCENEVKQLKKSGKTIIKTFSSECGSYFFNFDAEKQSYHVQLIAAGPKGNNSNISATMFDSDNEAAITTLSKVSGSGTETRLEGTISFRRSSVGTIHTDVTGTGCLGMYIIVYQ